MKKVMETKRIGIFILDILFFLAWIGFVVVVVWICISFLISCLHDPQSELLPYWGNQIFWLDLITWILLGGAMFVSCAINIHNHNSKEKLWLKLLLWNIFIVGPTAYYIGSFRRKILNKNNSLIQLWLKKSTLLDGLYIVSYWSTIIFLVCAGIGYISFMFSDNLLAFFITSTLLLLPLVGISSMAFMTFLLLDAAERSPEQWEKTNFLKLLNPWSWIFGARKYYLQVMRPDIYGA